MGMRWLKVLLPVVLLVPWYSNRGVVMGDYPLTYVAQSGDTLEAVAARFRVKADHITSAQPIPQEGLLPPGMVLYLLCEPKTCLSPLGCSPIVRSSTLPLLWASIRLPT